MMENRALVCVADFENEALQVLDKNSRNYFRSGADDEITLLQNKLAFSRWFIRPRMLRDVSSRKLEKIIFGKPVAFPVGVSPVAFQSLAHPQAEILSARAAAALGSVFVLSTFSNWSIEDIAKHAPGGRKWFQLFPNSDKKVTESLLRRAEASGFEAIVVTLDAQNFGKKRDTMREPFQFPDHLRIANLESNKSDPVKDIAAFVHNTLAQDLTWETISWIQKTTKLPVILKGILTTDDALLAVEQKVAGIWISNHGGRQVDTAIPTIDALPEIAKVVRKRCAIFLDSGIRRGSDVFKALAVGADMVFVGRPMIWGITVEAESGARRILGLLRDELDLTMALAGVADVNEITSAYAEQNILSSKF